MKHLIPLLLLLGLMVFVVEPSGAQRARKAAPDGLSSAGWALWEQLLAPGRCTAPNGPCDLTAGTTVAGVPITGGGETNTGSNLGGGLANYSTKVGSDLRFNSFDAADFDLTGNLIGIDPTKWLTITAAAAAHAPVNPTLGTQTQGNYMAGISGDTEAVVSHTPGEGSSASLSIGAGIARDSEVSAGYQPLSTNLTSYAGVAPSAFALAIFDETSALLWRTSLSAQEANVELDYLGTNCILENDSTPIPDSCVGDGTDGGGGGGGNSVEQSIVLSGGSGFFSQAVTGQAWVTTSSEIVCTPLGTTDDSLTPEAIAIGGLQFSVSDRSAGVGFNINVYSPNGLEGTIRAHCIGV